MVKNINVERYGDAFSQSKINDIKAELNKAGLPIIPSNPTIEDIEKLLVYLGNTLAYTLMLQTQVLILKEEKEREWKQAYNQRYTELEAQSADKTVTTLKKIVENNSNIKKLYNELTETIQTEKYTSCKLAALKELNFSVKKLVELKIVEIKGGL